MQGRIWTGLLSILIRLSLYFWIHSYRKSQNIFTTFNEIKLLCTGTLWQPQTETEICFGKKSSFTSFTFDTHWIERYSKQVQIVSIGNEVKINLCSLHRTAGILFTLSLTLENLKQTKKSTFSKTICEKVVRGMKARQNVNKESWCEPANEPGVLLLG